MARFSDDSVGEYLSKVAEKLNDKLPDDWVSQRKKRVESILREYCTPEIAARVDEHFDFLNGKGEEPVFEDV